jgi:hypothetical protein
MNYKPDKQELMAYLYDELEGTEKARVEQYLVEHPEELSALQKLRDVSSLLKSVKDKEVIAPPIFIPDGHKQRFWNAPYFKTVMSIAASLLVLLLVGKFIGTRVAVSDSEFRISFGDPVVPSIAEPASESLTSHDVQEMINESLHTNNAQLTANWEESQKELQQSINGNLVMNSEKMDQLIKEASGASRDQVSQFVSTMQAENLKMVKDYFALTSNEQKEYIEGMLVDFAKYLQQQRKDDLQLVEMRINSIERNSNLFQQETEQILTSIISNVGSPQPMETKY